MLTVGIDPGLQVTGLAALQNDEIVATRSVRGASGVGNDYALASATACAIALDARAWISDLAPGLLAVETFVDQGQGRRFRYGWHTPLVIGALTMALREWATITRWQDASQVLDNGPKGYGVIRYLARQGRLGHGLGGPVDEHVASAIAHAMWAAAVDRQMELVGV